MTQQQIDITDSQDEAADKATTIDRDNDDIAGSNTNEDD